MTRPHPGKTEGGRTAAARLKASRSQAIKGTRGARDNAAANQRALKKMSFLERECGLTAEQYSEFHAAQRRRVLARYGVRAA